LRKAVFGWSTRSASTWTAWWTCGLLNEVLKNSGKAQVQRVTGQYRLSQVTSPRAERRGRARPFRLFVGLEDLRTKAPRRFAALAELSLSVDPGEFVCIVGPVRLRQKYSAVAGRPGLDQPTTGTVSTGNRQLGP